MENEASKQQRTGTFVYDWIAERPDLTWLEKLIICNVLRYGENGCFQSNSSIARRFNFSRRKVIQIIGKLVREGWLAPLYETNYKRVLYVTTEKLSTGPLFDLPSKSLKIVTSGHQVVTSGHQNSDLRSPKNTCTLDNRVQREHIKQLVNEFSRKHSAKPLTRAQNQERKQMLQAQCEQMK